MPDGVLRHPPRVEAAPIVAAVVVLVCAGASFFFSLAETALFSLSKWQVRELSAQTGQRGLLASRLLTEPQDLIATIALGNTFTNVAMMAIGLWAGLGGHLPLWWTLVVVLLLSLFVGEVLPKILAVRRPEVWARRGAHPLAWLQRVTRVV
ncbi:MAG: DUF21 domain-containing protein, partial [Verrucomicrobiota bacterium]